MKIKNLALAAAAVALGVAANAQDTTGHKTDTTKKDSVKSFAVLTSYQDTTKKDTTKKDSVMLLQSVAFYQDTTKKDAPKKDTSSLKTLAYAFYQDTTKKDTTKKDSSLMRMAFYQDTTKKDTTKKDSVSLNNLALNNVIRANNAMVAEAPENVSAKTEQEFLLASKETEITA